MKNENAAKMLLTYFNMTMKSRYSFSSRGEEIDALISEDGNNVSEIRSAIKEWAESGRESDISAFVNWYKYDKKKDGKEPSSAFGVELGMRVLSDTVAKVISSVKSEEIKNAVVEGINEKVDAYIRETYGVIEKTTRLVTEFGKKEVKGVLHEKFDTVLKFVANDEPIYLSGPAGSGKNVLCKQVADALGLEFYFTNAVTQEYKLTGFTDANGVFHESQFYKAFKNGGLFMLDEMDASIPEVLIILNAAIANRYFDFPAPVGKIEAHKDFRVIAAGNTLGHGASNEYVGRNTLDASSLDRFAVIKVDYDERIEMNISGGNKELVDFCHAFRKATEKAGIHVVVSYRAIGRMAKMLNLLPVDEVIESCLVKGLEQDDLKAIESDLSGFGRFSVAMRIIRERA